MPHHSCLDKDISESELEDYEYKYYKKLKNGRFEVKISDSVYRCPFCRGHRIDYLLQELLHHASGIGRSRQGKRKKRAKHSALENFVRRHLMVKDKAGCSKPDSFPALHNKNQLFVWPAMGILANIQVELENGRSVGASGSKLRNELTAKGFDPVGVYPLWDHSGDSGFAIVEFKKDWAGFKDAMMFEKDFEARKCGKKEYLGPSDRNRRNKLFGWVARNFDCHSCGLISEHLQNNGDLINFPENEAGEQRMKSMLISNLTDLLQMKREHLKELQSKFSETSVSLSKLKVEYDRMIRSHNQEMRKMQRKAHHHFDSISIEHEKARQNLEARRKELEQQEDQLQQCEELNERRKELEQQEDQFQQCEELNESKRNRLHHDSTMNRQATLEQKAEEHKGEKELLRENELKALLKKERKRKPELKGALREALDAGLEEHKKYELLWEQYEIFRKEKENEAGKLQAECERLKRENQSLGGSGRTTEESHV